ncbi:hypothetical protein ciss_19320 [Carboxydothermus islandicus]|uniref:Hydrolase n=1 Tax=Carboxydothermus islandicus TaxID=661089 RepID=A0A1L8D499_9THEO|nr:metal-dependent hydrolase [Carboxydothermus islandicus]GAV25999.1 hypothetical protein ciss_19320 [Carboxydothermus islandicus]
MDNLTHGLIGYALAKAVLPAGTDPALAKAITIASVLASEAPDVDFVTRAWGPLKYFEYHRTLTHAPWGVVTLSFLSAVIAYFLNPKANFGYLFGIALVSGFIHVGMDLLTSYGTALFWPLSKKLYSYDILMIVDLYILLIFAGGFLLFWLGKSPQKVFLSTLLLVLIYIGARWQIQHHLWQKVAFLYPEAKITVYPDPLDLFSWRYIAQEGKTIHQGEAKFLSGKIIETKTLESSEIPEESRVVLSTPEAKAFLNFAKFTYVKVKDTPEGRKIYLLEPRYHFRGHYVFGVLIELDRQNKVVKTYLNQSLAD